MSQDQTFDLPVNTAIVLAGAIAILAIKGYAFTSSKGDELAPNQSIPFEPQT